MKIGIDISQIVYQTGVSRYTEQLVKHLVANNQDDHYHLFGGSLRQKQILWTFINELKGPRVHGSVKSLSPLMADVIWNRLGIVSPDNWLPGLDVFHSSNWAIPPTRAKLVTTVHDLTFLKYRSSHTSYSIAAHSRQLRRAKKYASLIIANSLATKNDLVEEGISPEKIRVTYLAPAKVFKPITNLEKLAKMRNKYGLKKPYLLSVGTQEPRKNLKRLIQSFSQLSSVYPKLNLVIVGKFGWGERITPVKGVKLLGFIPDEDLSCLYSDAKMFIYPSLYEGFGLPILEAMACGCPVITSNVSSMPELGGDAAIYVNPRSITEITKAIKQLIKADFSKHKTLMDLGINQAKNFSWDKTARQTLAVYREVSK